jgi:transcription initiation factor TFIIIB Brf1 subunit/transcription initiation factor TFIIB
MEEIEKPKCPKCGSQIVYYRITTQEQVCRKCGFIMKKIEED